MEEQSKNEEVYELRRQMYEMEKRSQDLADFIKNVLKETKKIWDYVKDDIALNFCTRANCRNAMVELDDLLRDAMEDVRLHRRVNDATLFLE